MSVYDPAKKLPKKALREITLASGGHNDRSNGLCVMEVAAWLAGQPHSDRPPCVSPTIGAFLRSWNDALNTDDRQMLRPYAAKVLNTATGAQDDETRAWLATDWLVRKYAPAWLRLAGLTEQAETLERLVALTSAKRAVAAKSSIAAAGAAAWDAARAAARAAAWDAAWDALAPTTKALQKSALLLLDRMIAVGKTTA